MRVAMGSLNPFTAVCFGGPDEYDAAGNPCCWFEQITGQCTPVLTTATGNAPANLTPPAPIGSGVNYNPDTQIGQMQQAVIDQSAANAAAAGGQSGGGAAAVPADSGTPSLFDTSTLVLLGIAGVLAVILAVKK